MNILPFCSTNTLTHIYPAPSWRSRPLSVFPLSFLLKWRIICQHFPLLLYMRSSGNEDLARVQANTPAYTSCQKGWPLDRNLTHCIVPWKSTARSEYLRMSDKVKSDLYLCTCYEAIRDFHETCRHDVYTARLVYLPFRTTSAGFV